MKRWWQVPGAAHAFSFFPPSAIRVALDHFGCSWCARSIFIAFLQKPGLWDGGVKQPCFFFRTFQKLPFYRYFGETPWGSSHVEAGSAQFQAQLSTAQPHPKSRCHGSCPHICSACPPQGKRVSVEPQLDGSETKGWMAQTGLAQETQDFVEAADVQVLYRCIQEKMTLERRWSPFGWFSQVRYVSSPVSKRFLELLLQYLCDAEIIHPPNQRLNRSLNFTTMLQIHPSLS